MLNIAPEYDDCAALALAAGLPFKRVYAAAQAAALPLWSSSEGEMRPISTASTSASPSAKKKRRPVKKAAEAEDSDAGYRDRIEALEARMRMSFLKSLDASGPLTAKALQ